MDAVELDRWATRARTTGTAPWLVGAHLTAQTLPIFRDRQATYEDCVFTGCEILLAAMTRVNFVSCRFHDCRFDLDNEVSAEAASFDRCRFYSCDMSGLRFQGSVFLAVDFDDCSLSNSRFMDCQLQQVGFHATECTQIAFGVSQFEQVVFDCCDISGTNFTLEQMTHCEFLQTSSSPPSPAGPIRYQRATDRESTGHGSLWFRHIDLESVAVGYAELDGPGVPWPLDPPGYMAQTCTRQTPDGWTYTWVAMSRGDTLRWLLEAVTAPANAALDGTLWDESQVFWRPGPPAGVEQHQTTVVVDRGLWTYRRGLAGGDQSQWVLVFPALLGVPDGTPVPAPWVDPAGTPEALGRVIPGGEPTGLWRPDLSGWTVSHPSPPGTSPDSLVLASWTFQGLRYVVTRTLLSLERENPGWRYEIHRSQWDRGLRGVVSDQLAAIPDLANRRLAMTFVVAALTEHWGPGTQPPPQPTGLRPQPERRRRVVLRDRPSSSD